MENVCIIGNNASNLPISDGGRIKVRLYRDLLTRSGVDARILDLDGWKKRFLFVIREIKKAIKRGEVLLIMAGPKGSRMLIPLVNALNRKKHTRVVFCPLGIGTLEKPLEKLDEKQVIDFLNCNSFFGISDKRMAAHLARLDTILPQNEIIARCYKDFYKLDNLYVLNNFRDVVPEKKNYAVGDALNLLFLSRVCEEKGIFDLIDAVYFLNKHSKRIHLNIYGEIQLSDRQKKTFFERLNSEIEYKGIINPTESISVLKQHDLFVLPTKYAGEGTSGALIEAFLSGTPVLISSYSQAKKLVNDGADGWIFEIGNQTSLTKKLLYIFDHRNQLESFGLAAQRKAEIYTFRHNKDSFLEGILGTHI